MNEKPIVFSERMVDAILNTKPNVWPPEKVNDKFNFFKSMTRRILKPRYRKGESGFEVSIRETTKERTVHIIDEEGAFTRVYDPPYEIGDVLYVKETWRVSCVGTGGGDWATIVYKNGVKTIDISGKQSPYYATKARWQSPRFMRHEASRIKLKVVGVGLERIQDIRNEDALREGMSKGIGHSLDMGLHAEYDIQKGMGAVAIYSKYWDVLNEKRGYSWESNPWVWVYEFMRLS